MENPNQFIKIFTVVIFASLMAGFVIFKSGCISTNEADKGKEAEDIDFIEVNEGLEELVIKEGLDTVWVKDTEYYALTTKMFPGSKMALAITPDDIKGFLHKDSLPKDFVSWMGVDSTTFNEWKKQQKNKEEADVKPLIAPSSKSAPVFEEPKPKKKKIIPGSKSGAVFEDDGE